MCLGTQGVVSILVFCNGNKKNDINKEDRVKNAKNLFFLDFSSILIVFYPENVIEKTLRFFSQNKLGFLFVVCE